MKMSRRVLALILGTFALLASNCGLDPGQSAQTQAAEEADQNVAHGSTDDAELAAYLQDDVADQDAATLPEEDEGADSQVMQTLRELHETLRAEIADCGGFSAEAAALKDLRQSLPKKDDELTKEEMKSSFEAIRDELQAAHEALRAKIDANRATVKACFKAQQKSETKQAIDAIHDACLGLDLPPPPGGPRGFGKGSKGPEGGPIGPKPPRKGRKDLPKLPTQNFDSEECKAAVEAGSSLI